MTTKALLAIFLLSLTFASCKDDKDLDSSLFGTWNVTRVDGHQYVIGNTGVHLSDSSPSGTIRFDSDGTGEQNYYFTLFGQTYPNIAQFSWEADDHEIRIDRYNEPDMVWHRDSSEANKQVATYNIVISATENWDYTLTLEK